MTWFQYDNYGTVLQSTAIKHVVTKMGYDLDGIDYVSRGYNRETKIEKFLNVFENKNKVKYKISDKKYKKFVVSDQRKESFDLFRNNHMTMTRSLKTSSELYQLNYEYDAFICGSDQIWTPRAYNSKYYLDFVADSNKKIAYAPSFGLTTIENPILKKRVKESLYDFKYLSVREEQGASIIKEITGKEAKVVVDPTLLLNEDEWDNYIIERKIERPYILCYFLGRNEKYWKHVNELSKKLQLEIVILPIYPKDYTRFGHIDVSAGPGEFLSLIKNANLVCTDSYHGTIFSIIYKRPFLCYKRFSDKDKYSQNSRIYNLLNKLNLNDCIVKNYDVSLEKKINLNNNTYNMLNNEVIFSKKYLEDSLSKAITSTFDEYNYAITNTCCGCGVCRNVCSNNAIKIIMNADGFYIATRDMSKCIRCGLCKKVCAFNGDRGNTINAPLYMLRSKSDNVLNTSTSGGAAYEISRLLSEKGYDVYGCTYDKNKNIAKHGKVKSGDLSSLKLFQGSKYIQSNVADSIKEINTSYKTVFFGTPCQIAGLDNLLRLKKKRKNFILVELICFGVPTIHLWHKYLYEIKSKFKLGVNTKVFFRYKPKGWKIKYICVKGDKKVYLKKDSKDMFYRYFELRNCFMPSCYECNYRDTSKADIKIGDYWGDKYDMYKKSGASMVLGITQEGILILEELAKIDKVDLVKESCIDYYMIQGVENPIIPNYYNELINELKKNDSTLSSIMRKYFYIYDINKKLSNAYSKIKKIFK